MFVMGEIGKLIGGYVLRCWRAVVLVCCFFSSRRRHTRCGRDWSSDVCSSDLAAPQPASQRRLHPWCPAGTAAGAGAGAGAAGTPVAEPLPRTGLDRGTALLGLLLLEIGRASCRGRVEGAGGGGWGWVWGVAAV